ncbi:CDP-alcohol phosphatidyltransferase family protein [Bosea psychrotolerans]|uniref:CDP-alcohol phosphatidyltransferase family protein n=1 Tax=Bosea psychrotolerans TaxID=1871628 RepID=UPI000CDA7E24|nr:CDP-alcohol phosphatidyltransferase family protein [Bosea psychrotolerans]
MASIFPPAQQPSLIRIHNSLVASVERQALTWLVRRIPARVTPDSLTAFGVFGAFVSFVGYALTAWSPAFLWLASLGLLFHWFGDSLDGSLARFRKIERPRYGYFLDQTIDVIGNLLICVGMGLTAYVRMDAALLAMAGYHALSIYSLVRACVSGEFHVSLAGTGPTETRLLIVMMNTMIFFFGAPLFMVGGIAMTWCDITVILMTAGYFITFVYFLVSYARRLAREEGVDSETASKGMHS